MKKELKRTENDGTTSDCNDLAEWMMPTDLTVHCFCMSGLSAQGRLVAASCALEVILILFSESKPMCSLFNLCYNVVFRQAAACKDRQVL